MKIVLYTIITRFLILGAKGEKNNSRILYEITKAFDYDKIWIKNYE
jgi:hypothetical protein